MKTLLTTTLAALLAMSGASAGTYRVFYYVRGEHWERPGKFSTAAASECDVREALLAAEPRAIKSEINLMDEADNYGADGKAYVLRPAGSTVTPDLVEEGTAYLLAGSEKAKEAKKAALDAIATKDN